MTRNFNNRTLAVSQKIYGRLLRAYPAAHRAEYGAAMAQLFRDQCRAAWNEARGWGVVKLWLRVLPDLVKTSVSERLAALNKRKSMSDKISAFLQPRAAFRKVFLAVFLLILCCTVAVTFLLPETYASTARMKVENDGSATGYDPYYIQTQFEIMESQLVLQPVIEKLNLNIFWGKKYFAGRPLKTSETMEMLKNRLRLEPIRNTKLMSITAYSDDKEEAAHIANAIAGAYRDYRANARAESAARGLAELQRQYKIQEQQIHAAESEVEALRAQLEIVDNAAARVSPPEQPYWDKKRDLSQLLDLHKLLFAKIEAGKLDAQIPKTLVQITDTAEPGRAPVKPNKPLNLAAGIFFGVASAGGLGAGAAVIAARINRRKQKLGATV